MNDTDITTLFTMLGIRDFKIEQQQVLINELEQELHLCKDTQNTSEE